MTSLYVCAFPRSGTNSYYSDWADAFERRGFVILNVYGVNIANIIYTVFKCNYNSIVFGYSCYYGLQGRSLSLLQKFCRFFRGPVIGFMQNEFRNFSSKVSFLDNLYVNILVSQFPLDVAEEFYSGRTQAEKIVSLPHAMKTPNNHSTISHGNRAVDIGSRLMDYPLYTGNIGRMKTLPLAINTLRGQGKFKIDWDSNPENRFRREEWFDFLSTCRTTFSCEAGSSFLQWSETLRKKCNSLQSERSDFDFLYSEILSKSSAHLSGGIVSARHFDAIACGACNVLTPGRYCDVLLPEKHYITLNFDLSNLNEVVEKINDVSFTEDVAKEAYSHAVSFHTLDHRLDYLVDCM